VISRRQFCLRSGAALGVALPAAARAALSTGVYVLDTPSIPVRAPARVFLEAVARTANRLVAVGEHGVVIYSDDEGMSWRQASVPVDVTLTCIAFATPETGWCAGHFGAVLQTVDGGVTWQSQLNGITANQLAMAAAQAAVAANSAAPGAPFALRRANIFLRDGPNKPFLSIIAISPLKVIVFGAFRMTMLTLDGGRSWADISLSIGDRLSHNLYAALATGGDIYVAGETGEVFRSTDGGKTFPPVTSPTGATIFGLLAAQDSSILAFGVAGNLFNSKDQGMSWQNITMQTQDDLTSGLTLRSGDILIGTEAGALFVSKDNGRSFTSVTGGPRMAIFGMVETQNGQVVFVGDAGAVTMSTSSLTSS
jgi:photosystem II stability/assembly factor-like uncharacterized protein